MHRRRSFRTWPCFRMEKEEKGAHTLYPPLWPFLRSRTSLAVPPRGQCNEVQTITLAVLGLSPAIEPPGDPGISRETLSCRSRCPGGVEGFLRSGVLFLALQPPRRAAAVTPRSEIPVTGNPGRLKAYPGRAKSDRNRVGQREDGLGDWVVEVTYGRIGANGHKKTRLFPDEKIAWQEVLKCLKRRINAPKRIGVSYMVKAVNCPEGRPLELWCPPEFR